MNWLDEMGTRKGPVLIVSLKYGMHIRKWMMFIASWAFSNHITASRLSKATYLLQDVGESRCVPVISRVQDHPRRSTHSGVPADRGASCGNSLPPTGEVGPPRAENGGHDRAERAAPSILPLTRNPPTQLPHSTSKQPTHRHRPSTQPRDPSTTKPSWSTGPSPNSSQTLSAS